MGWLSVLTPGGGSDPAAPSGSPASLAVRCGFHKLPTEILQVIFHFAIVDVRQTTRTSFHDFPYSAVLVCKEWSLIVSDMPGLWRRIDIGVKDDPKNVSKKVAWHRKYAGNLPLCVALTLHAEVSRKWIKEVRPALWPHRAHFKKVQVTFPFDAARQWIGPSTDSFEKLFWGVPMNEPSAFEKLEELTMTQSDGTDLSKSTVFLALHSSLPNLRTLVMDIPTWIPTSYYGYGPEFPNLRRLVMNVKRLGWATWWVRTGAHPLLEDIGIQASEKNDAHDNAFCSSSPPNHREFIRRVVLLGFGVDTTRILLQGLQKAKALVLDDESKSAADEFRVRPKIEVWGPGDVSVETMVDWLDRPVSME